MFRHAYLKPILATVLLVLAAGGYQSYVMVTGTKKLPESRLPAPGARANFEVVLDFAPESFHQTRMQALGRLVRVDANSVFMADVGRKEAITLARNYWVAEMRPWDGKQ